MRVQTARQPLRGRLFSLRWISAPLGHRTAHGKDLGDVEHACGVGGDPLEGEVANHFLSVSGVCFRKSSLKFGHTRVDESPQISVSGQRAVSFLQ